MDILNVEKAKKLFKDLENTKTTLIKLNKILNEVTNSNEEWWNSICKHGDGSGWCIKLNGIVSADDMLTFAINKADQRLREIEFSINKL